MRIGLYGGTFDPVHLGHVHAALAVQEALQLDHVRMVLSARPGHREQPNTANVHRWEMLKLACDEHPTLRADDSEIQRPGVSYAIDTLRQIRANDPQVDGERAHGVQGQQDHIHLLQRRNDRLGDRVGVCVRRQGGAALVPRAARLPRAPQGVVPKAGADP